MGASLLANAVVQPPHASTDTKPSRAGSLPQGISGGLRIGHRHKKAPASRKADGGFSVEAQATSPPASPTRSLGSTAD
ncbi:hypothetical protein PspCFBP13508_18360 [Pseudomonas sp. CFBP13508]|nr:hypothetical protein PspCFBP13508_18360 [Pseudomonas sp. CFBP13508]